MDHVVEKRMIGPTEIIFCDDKCIPREEVGKELKELARRVKPYLARKHFEETA